MATPVIDVLRPVTRQQGAQIPGLLPTSRWIDAFALAAGVAEAYTLPAGSILRLRANVGPVYANFNGAASVPTDTVDGTASICLQPQLEPVLLTVPEAATALSLICPTVGGAVVTIEVWK